MKESRYDHSVSERMHINFIHGVTQYLCGHLFYVGDIHVCLCASGGILSGMVV